MEMGPIQEVIDLLKEHTVLLRREIRLRVIMVMDQTEVMDLLTEAAARAGAAAAIHADKV
jgi:hypothetical protein